MAGTRRRRSRIGARSNALFIVPIPLLFTAFGGGPVGLATDLAAFFVLIWGARFTREGLRAEDAFESRETARRPTLPRKGLGAGATALGLALAGLPDPVAAAIFAIVGAALHVASFGTDPWRDKVAGGAEAAQGSRAARAVEEAEATLNEMRDAAVRTRDAGLEARVSGFAKTARGMFRRVEADPRDLGQARRWLGVYLAGARDAAVKYADLVERGGAPEARADFLGFLDELEQGYATRTERMLLDDRSDLDIEIDVLRERVAREDAAVPEPLGAKE